MGRNFRTAVKTPLTKSIFWRVRQDSSKAVKRRVSGWYLWPPVSYGHLNYVLYCMCLVLFERVERLNRS